MNISDNNKKNGPLEMNKFKGFKASSLFDTMWVDAAYFC